MIFVFIIIICCYGYQGADDDLVKVWSSQTGALVATLRGHSAEITDVSISRDNHLIATGSLDKTVRVWCGHTSAPLAVLSGHHGHVTSVQVRQLATPTQSMPTSAPPPTTYMYWPIGYSVNCAFSFFN